MITYGLDSHDADLRGEDVRVEGGRSRCRVVWRRAGQTAPEVLGDALKRDYAKWARLVRERGLKMD